MSRVVAGFFRDGEGVIHRVTGSTNSEPWAPPVAWQVFSLCGRERKRDDKEPSTAVLQVTCVSCIARTTD